MRAAGNNLTMKHLLQAYCVLELHASPHPPQCAHWGTFPPRGKAYRKRPAGMAGLCYQLTFSVTPGTLAISRATAAVRMISGTM